METFAPPKIRPAKMDNGSVYPGDENKILQFIYNPDPNVITVAILDNSDMDKGTLITVPGNSFFFASQMMEKENNA